MGKIQKALSDAMSKEVQLRKKRQKLIKQGASEEELLQVDEEIRNAQQKYADIRI